MRDGHLFSHQDELSTSGNVCIAMPPVAQAPLSGTNGPALINGCARPQLNLLDSCSSIVSIDSCPDAEGLTFVPMSAVCSPSFPSFETSVPSESRGFIDEGSRPVCMQAKLQDTKWPSMGERSTLVRVANFAKQSVPSPWLGGDQRELHWVAPERSLSFEASAGGVPVRLHIYDVSQDSMVQWLNSLLLPAQLGGAFHAGVEVGGLEWSFAYNPREMHPGVQCVLPQCDPQHHFRETLDLGPTRLSAEDITSTIRDLIEDYPGTSYDLLHRNCCHFADDFCKRLGVGPFPDWVYRLARLGAQANDVVQAVLSSIAQTEDVEPTGAQAIADTARSRIPHPEVDDWRLNKALLVLDDLFVSGQTLDLYPLTCASSPVTDHVAHHWRAGSFRTLGSSRHEREAMQGVDGFREGVGVEAVVPPVRYCNVFPSQGINSVRQTKAGVPTGIFWQIPRQPAHHDVTEDVASTGKANEFFPVARAYSMEADELEEYGSVPTVQEHVQEVQRSKRRMHRVDAQKLTDALNFAEELVATGRTCELFPVSRAFSMAPEPGQEVFWLVDSGCRADLQTIRAKRKPHVKALHLERQEHGLHRRLNRIPRSIGGC